VRRLGGHTHTHPDDVLNGRSHVERKWGVTARIWDAHLQTMAVEDLLAQACERLAGVTKLTREEMRLAGYPDSVGEIDECTSGQ
jgi:hypothetical protein